MRRFVALAAIVFAALTFAGSASPLIGGTPTGTAQHTNVGAFGVVLNGTFLEVCSGTVIEPNVVVTAGHCTFFFEQLESRTTPLDVVFTLDPSPTAASPSYDAVDFFTHPDYVDELRGNSKCGLFGECTTDVGLAELGTASTATLAARAPRGYVDTLDLKSQLFTIVGYGTQGFANAQTPIGPDGWDAQGRDVRGDRPGRDPGPFPEVVGTALPHQHVLRRLGWPGLRERQARRRRLVRAEHRLRIERVLHAGRHGERLELDREHARDDQRSLTDDEARSARRPAKRAGLLAANPRVMPNRICSMRLST